MRHSEVELDQYGEFRRYLRIMDHKTRPIGHYACIDHTRLSPIWRKYLFARLGKRSVESPRLIQALIDWRTYKAALTLSYERGGRGEETYPQALSAVADLMPALHTLEDFRLFLRGDTTFRCTTVDGRILGIAWATMQIEARDFAACLREAELETEPLVTFRPVLNEDCRQDMLRLVCG